MGATGDGAGAACVSEGTVDADAFLNTAGERLGHGLNFDVDLCLGSKLEPVFACWLRLQVRAAAGPAS